jgi:uncharacterized protein (TIGR03435 family)
MRSIIVGFGLSVFAGGMAVAQTAEDTLTFEIASVKQSGPASVRNFEGGPGTKDPGRYTATSAVLRDLLFAAYRVRGDFSEQISGPAWIDTEKYDVAIEIPPGTTKEQFQRMLQNLLAERFQVAIHHETKVFPIYELVVAKNGPKLNASVENSGIAGEPPSKGLRPVDRDGFPVLPAGHANIAARFGPGTVAHWIAHQQAMEEFARMLNQPLAAGRKVIDKTGLTGKYDFKLFYQFEVLGKPPSDSDEPAPTLDRALQQQLGLKLVDAKAPFDVVVVDHAERVPTEN